VELRHDHFEDMTRGHFPMYPTQLSFFKICSAIQNVSAACTRSSTWDLTIRRYWISVPSPPPGFDEARLLEVQGATTAQFTESRQCPFGVSSYSRTEFSSPLKSSVQRGSTLSTTSPLLGKCG
jgi:hypothetical protein